MADEIICIDDSDEETDKKIASISTTTTVRNNKSSVPRVSLDKEVVDLLGSSDDDDDDEAPPTAISSTIAKKSRAKMGRNGNASDSDDSVLKAQIERAKRVSLSQTSNSGSRRQHGNQNNGYGSDSDDDSLLNFDTSATKKARKQTNEKLGPATPKNLPLAQSASASTATRSTHVVNPYAKAKAPNMTPGSASTKTSTGVAASVLKTIPLQDPYSSSNKKRKKSADSSAPTGKSSNNHGAVNSSSGNGSDSSSSAEFVYPTLLAHSKTHEDVRPRYLLAFWKYARSLTHHSHDANDKLEQIMDKIVSLAFWPHPLRSLEEFMLRGRKSNGGSISVDRAKRDDLQEQLNKGGLDRFQVPVDVSREGRYCSIAEACLVAMYQEIQRRKKSRKQSSYQQSLEELLTSKDMYITLYDLIPEIEKRLQPFCPAGIRRPGDPDGGVAYYTDRSTRSVEYRQILKLKVACTKHTTETDEGYIKERKLNKQVAFILTPLGYKTAEWIQQRTFPAPPGHYRTSHIEKLSDVKPIHKDICLAMDLREGGHSKFVLHKFCNKLDWKKIPYFVGSLDIGDYAFFSTKPGTNNLLCPILVERKSIQDVAQSIADGRWKNQKRRMYHGQYVFGYDNCRIAYLIEGKEERQQVTGGYISHRKFKVTREQLDDAIDGLKQEGFDVIRSTSSEDSMFKLSRWAERVAQEVRSGVLKPQYTYEEFKAEVKKIPAQVDFSLLARDAMATRVEKEKNAEPGISWAASTTEWVEKKKNAKANTATATSKTISAEKHLETSDAKAMEPASRLQSTGCQENASRSSSKKRKADISKIKAKPTAKETPLESAPGSPIVLCEYNTSGVSSSDESDDDGLLSDSDNETLLKTRKYLAEYSKKKLKEEKRKKKKNTLNSGKKKKQKTKCSPPTSSQDHGNASSGRKNTDNDTQSEYEEWSNSQLQKKCTEMGLPKNGTKQELIKRLRGPKPPKLWLERKKKGEYVPPRHDVGSTALLVALYLHEREQNVPDAPGMTKDELYAKAEELEITKNPFSGGTTQMGPYHYDGWANMKKLLEGDPPLVIKKKHSRYKLTRSCNLAGFEFAKAMHKWCHEHSNCPCQMGEHY